VLQSIVEQSKKAYCRQEFGLTEYLKNEARIKNQKDAERHEGEKERDRLAKENALFAREDSLTRAKK